MKAIKGKKKLTNVSFIEQHTSNYASSKVILCTSKSAANYKPNDAAHNTISRILIRYEIRKEF